MDFFSYFFSSPIQLGFDIATSLTIIGSLFYFVITMRRRAKEERSQRFDKQVRSTAAEQLSTSIDRLSALFIESVIGKSEEFRRAFGLSEKDGLENETKLLKMDGRIEDAVKKLEKASEAVGNFYEVLHREKYSVIPVIDSIEDNEKLVDQFNKQISQIAKAYNQLNSSAKPLIRHLVIMSNKSRELCDSSGVSDFKSFHGEAEKSGLWDTLVDRAAAIVYDEDYFFWVKSFIPDELELSFEENIKNTKSLKEMNEECRDIFKKVCISIIGYVFEEPERLYAQVLLSAYNRQVLSNQACKEVLINLSSILKYLLKSDSDGEKLFDTVEVYKTSKYFDLENAVR